MVQIFSRGESVYRCDVCTRSTRVPTNNYSITVVDRCTITLNCPGKLHRVLSDREINNTPAISPAVPGLQDWFQRRVLFTHSQTIESDSWDITHNLGTNPSIQVFTTRLVNNIETLVEIDPKLISIIDLNTVTITFDQPTSGVAQCIAYTSRNNINPGLHETVIEDVEDVLLTNSGELTIATLSSAALVNVSLVFKNAITNTDVPVDYVGVGKAVSSLSPWVGVPEIFVGGRSYTIRSFNVLTTPTAPTVFSTIPIANGTPVFFANLPPEKYNTLILLGNSPFSASDRIVDRFIEAGAVSSEQPQLYYDSGDLYADPAFSKKAYPHIIAI